MVAVASCFAQILSLIDRAGFARAVRQHQAERAAKGFSCWDHFVSHAVLSDGERPFPPRDLWRAWPRPSANSCT